MDSALIVEIVVSLFAVFGIYAAIREFARLALRKEKFYVGLELTGEADLSDLDGRIGAGVAMAGYDSHLECMPVVLVSKEAAGRMEELDVYQKLREKGLRVFVERR